jgi:hypothetical protein
MKNILLVLVLGLFAVGCNDGPLNPNYDNFTFGYMCECPEIGGEVCHENAVENGSYLYEDNQQCFWDCELEGGGTCAEGDWWQTGN